MRLPQRLEHIQDSIRRGAGFLRRHGVRAAARRLRADRLPFSPVPDYAYREWLRGSGAPTRGAIAESLRVSLLVPLHASKRENVADLYDSLRAQSYPRWQLCFSVDGPLAVEVKTLLFDLARRDDRVRVVEAADRPGISAATNAALRASSGELVGLLDHDDLLPPDVLQAVVQRFRDEPGLDLLYTDEDMISPGGERRSPLFKPGASPMLLLGTNYVMHLVVMRRTFLDRLGGFRPDFDGAQDHDLLLRAFENARRVSHLPRIGYHWRAGSTSVASGSAAKPWAYERGRRAVEEACMRRKLPVTRVAQSAVPGLYDLELAPLIGRPPVHVVVHGAGPASERWRRFLSTGSFEFGLASLTLGRWPEKVATDDPVLLVDARVVPDESALRELTRWIGAEGVGCVGAWSRGAFRPAPTGFGVSVTGRAHSLPALTLHARLPHEVAAPGTSLMLLSSPDPAWLEQLAGKPVSRVDLVCAGLAAWCGGRSALSLPLVRLRPRVDDPIDRAELDLTASTLWPRLARELPSDLWMQGADRFGRRHPLLCALGVPPAPRTTL